MLHDAEEAAREEDISFTLPNTGRAGLLARTLNLAGTPRRFFATWLFPNHVAQSIAMRRGDCNRCGLCCQLVVKCVFLRYENGLASCGCYEKRPPNCSKFPISQADIDEVNRIAPHAPCGYSFAPPCKTGG